MSTPEQEARDMLERMGVEDAQSFSAGDVVELANLIAAVRSLTWDDVASLRHAAAEWREIDDEGWRWAEYLAERIESLMPARTP